MYSLQLIKLMKNIFDYQNKNVWQVNSKGKICTFIMVASGNHILSSYQTYCNRTDNVTYCGILLRQGNTYTCHKCLTFRPKFPFTGNIKGT